MDIKVLLFAQARQIAGADTVTVSVGDRATVAELKHALSNALPDLESLLSRSSIALDQSYAVEDDVIDAEMEVAVIPPVSGG
jgi:molybdopterin converting factor subunit 1